MRLNKYIAACTSASRRTADTLIDEHRVTVNGEPAAKGMDVSENDRVEVDGTVIELPEMKSAYLYHKPKGVTCTARDRHALRTITDETARLGLPETVTYAGRLDEDSEGLLILTDDGDMIQELMRGGSQHEKEYLVTVDGVIADDALERMRRGMELPELKRRTLPCRVERTGESTFRIVLTQGLNRQIRRMCAECGYKVMRLIRIRIDDYELGDMKPGEIRQLKKGE